MNCTVKNRIYISDDLYYELVRIKNRIIFVPCPLLKKEQKSFLTVLKWNYPLKIDTLKAAQVHINSKWILKMDIKDFYSSVPFEHVCALVKRCFKHKKLIDAGYYINLVTVNNKLPVGAPTSAHLANACFKPIDYLIRNICSIYNITYSRYMDDLTFSSDSKEGLKRIEKRVTVLLNYFGYNLNRRKTKYICENKQQNVLGIVVNGRHVRIPKFLKRKVRAMIYNYMNFTYNKVVEKYVDKNVLQGYLHYIKHIDKPAYDSLMLYKKKLKKKFSNQ